MPVKFDPDAFEQDYISATLGCLKIVTELYNSEPFYGMCMYICSFYSDSIIYFNTESSYKQSLKDIAEKYPKYLDSKVKRWKLRWNPGDWGYSPYFLGEDVHADLIQVIEDPIKKHLHKWEVNARAQMDLKEITIADWDTYGLQLMETVCKAAVQVEKSEEFKKLPKTKDFKLIVSDHDEELILTYLRLNLYKTQNVIFTGGQDAAVRNLNTKEELAKEVNQWDEK